MTLTGAQVEVPDDADAFYELSLAEGWGDGAPLLPPTDDAIEALIACTPDAPDHVLGVLPPQYGIATVELIAANAAMAGVEPLAFPLVLAALEALTTREWKAFCMTTTTSRPPRLIARWIVPGVNHTVEPAFKGVSRKPCTSSVCNAPLPPMTTYASVEAVCRCGVPPSRPSGHRPE